MERLPELTEDHRVVIELSELQLPTLSRGTIVALYTNVTSDHLDRHGSLEAYRKVKRRLAELVDPRGALVINADDPVVRHYRHRGRADRHVPAAGPCRGRRAPRGLDHRLGDRRLPAAGGAGVHAGAGGRIMPVAELAIPGDHNVSNAMAAIAAALLFGVEPDAIRTGRGSVHGRRASPRARGHR